MKPHHPAALALVGWYLMTAPPTNHIPKDPSAPLGQWANLGSFDTARECEEMRLEGLKALRERIAKIAGSSLSKAKIDKVDQLSDQWIDCIATDDPRLKEK